MLTDVLGVTNGETATVGWELLNEDEGDHDFSITGTPAASGPKSG
jgi:hypothetical protein